MGYEIHIEQNEEITFDEWEELVEKTDGLRFMDSDQVVVNPKTGQEIRFPSSPGDAEMYVPTEDIWIPIFRFRSRVSFKAPANWGEAGDPIWEMVFHISHMLGAAVVGDEGEVYEYEKTTEPEPIHKHIDKRPVVVSKKWWQFWR